MKLISKKLSSICLLGAAYGSLFAISGNFTTPISGTNVIDGDIGLTFHPDNLYDNWGFKADAGEVISDDTAHTITINILEKTTPTASNGWGMYAVNGGKIDLKSAVIVNGEEHGMTGLIVYDNLSEISVGDNSRIVADTALTSFGKLSVGDNAYLKGNTWGGGAGTVVARNSYHAEDAGSITIGNGATIIMASSTDDEDKAQERHAVVADIGGTVAIGDDAVITLAGIAGVTSAGSSAVHVGSALYDQGGGTIRIGDRATITAEGNETAAIEAFNVGSQVIIGDYAKISTTDKSDAVLARVGSTISIGKYAEITTNGAGANGVYATVAPGSGTGRHDASIIIGDGATITTNGTNSSGVYANATSTAGNKAEIFLGKNVTINANGSDGIYGSYVGSKITADDGLVIKGGTASTYGVMAYYGAEIELKSTTILTPGTFAVYASSSNATSSKITINGDSIIDGLVRAGANGEISINGKLTMRSNIVANATGGVINAVFKGGSTLTGFTDAISGGVTNIDMTGTQWHMTRYSSVSNMSVAAGSVIYQTIKGPTTADTTGIWADSFSIDNSTIKVSLNGYDAVLGDIFYLVVADTMTVTGSFVLDLSGAALAEGLGWDTSNFAEHGYIEVVSAAAVPEPAEVAALIGLLAFGIALRRKR